MESLFLLISVILFALSGVLAALGTVASLPGFPPDDIEYIENVDREESVANIIIELWLMVWDTREFLYPAATAFAVALAFLLTSQNF